ncbi:hypothetical protein [Nocardia salmonicida]|uniref:hypothetical protein n=1 Tax=Nocardia salmonicida TaxID=53431 RepID=UPI0012F4EFF4|nr:hypothetical protein [Nocardia salmonicida]
MEASTSCRRDQIQSDPRTILKIAPTAQALQVSDARTVTSTQRDNEIEFEAMGIAALATPATAVSLPLTPAQECGNSRRGPISAGRCPAVVAQLWRAQVVMIRDGDIALLSPVPDAQTARTGGISGNKQNPPFRGGWRRLRPSLLTAAAPAIMFGSRSPCSDELDIHVTIRIVSYEWLSRAARRTTDWPADVVTRDSAMEVGGGLHPERNVRAPKG